MKHSVTACHLTALLTLGLLLGTGCGPRSTPDAASASPGADAGAMAPAEGEFSVMTYNLLRYSLEDRDGGGQRDDPKPVEEREALLDIIASASPDVLAIQEMGGPAVFKSLKEALLVRGLDYQFEELLQRDDASDKQINLAVLSRLPIVSHQSHTDDRYTIGKATDVPVARGFIDVDVGVNPAYQFKLMVAHLKSKVYHQLGQTEMRRNEARLLNKHVREALQADPHLNLLVVGDLNDTPPSRPIREIMGHQKKYLFDLRPRDALGDVWTHFRREFDDYSRIDYMLVSKGMRPEVVWEKTRAIRDPLTIKASDHRPLMAVFTAKDLPGEDTD